MKIKIESVGKSKRVLFDSKNFKEVVRFSPYRLSSERSEFDITQVYGLDANGETSIDFIPFESGSVEALLIDVIRDGRVERLEERGLILNERPLKGEISRNLSVYDPETNFCYTIGGLGLIRHDENDHTHFILSDPQVETIFSQYQGKRKKNVGGTCLFNEEGMYFTTNMSKIGTMEYESGPYHIVRKIAENIKLAKKGLNAPTFIAAGPIHNLENGKFGFSIYRSQLTPEYMLNLPLYLDQTAQFRNHYKTFIQSKYQQLALLHHQLGETHGQFSNTNTLIEIRIVNDEIILACQVKDFETNHPVPKNTNKIIDEGICPIDIGIKVRKSPHVASMIYDLQLSITQELNVLFIPLQSITDTNMRFQFILQKTLELILLIVAAYGVNPENTRAIQQFTINTFTAALNKGIDIANYNKILGGLISHAIYGFSKTYANQIEIVR